MLLKYTNSIEDLIELHLFLDTIKKNRIFYFKFRKIFLYVIYIFCICCIIYSFSLISKYSFAIEVIRGEGLNILGIIILVILFNRLVKLEPKFYLSRIKKAYKLAIEKNLNLIKEKEVTLKPNKFVVTIDNSETEINFESIYKIVENNDKIYILNKGYKALLIIPYEAFKDNDEKLDFLKLVKHSIQ